MEIRKSFTAKGGTVFSWHTEGSSDDIEVTLADDRVEWGEDVNKHPFPDREATWVAKIPRADLDEFIAHIVSQAAEETLGRVLLFPCLRKEPKLETGKSKFVAGEICPFCNCLYSEHTETDDEIRCPPPKSAA